MLSSLPKLTILTILLLTLTSTTLAATCPFSSTSLSRPSVLKRWFGSPPPHGPKPPKPGKQVVLTTNAPSPLPVFSQGLIHNGLVYVSGSTGVDPKTGFYVEGTIANRTTQALKNIDAILNAAGTNLGNALKIGVFISDWALYEEMNRAYGEGVPDPKPVRTTVAVKGLPKGTDVEIDAVAYL